MWRTRLDSVPASYNPTRNVFLFSERKTLPIADKCLYNMLRSGQSKRGCIFAENSIRARTNPQGFSRTLPRFVKKCGPCYSQTAFIDCINVLVRTFFIANKFHCNFDPKWLILPTATTGLGHRDKPPHCRDCPHIVCCFYCRYAAGTVDSSIVTVSAASRANLIVHMKGYDLVIRPTGRRWKPTPIESSTMPPRLFLRIIPKPAPDAFKRRLTQSKQG